MAQRGVAITPNSNHTGIEHLSGFTVRESAAIAAAATFRIRHASVSGLILETVELPANGSLTVSYGAGAWKESSGGAYVEVVAGQFEGTLFTEV